jgi:3-oxoadipate enol-lactonase
VTSVLLAHDAAGHDGAPVVVLAGSLGTTGAMWDPQTPALAERRRVIRLDLRGHGRSPVPVGPYRIEDLGRDVLATLDALGIARASWCGLSIGGMTGMWLAAHAPERVERLALLCTSAHLPPAEGWLERARAVRQAGTVAAVADTVLGRWVTPTFAAERPDVVAWLRAMLVSIPPEGYASCCEAIAALDLRADLAAIRAPTLVLSGADDPATPPAHGEAIAAAVSHARHVVLADAAHLANVQRADDVTRLVLDHLDPPEPA